MTLTDRAAPAPAPPQSAEAVYDAEEARRARAIRTEGIARWLLPLLVVIATIAGSSLKRADWRGLAPIPSPAITVT